TSAGWHPRGASRLDPAFARSSQLQKRLVHLSPWAHPRVQFDFAESSLIAGDILLQQSEESLGLLGAQIDALKVAQLDLRFALLLHRSKDKEEVPYIHAHLHAVGIGFPIVGGIGQFDIGLWRNTHRQTDQCPRLSG